MYPWRLKLFITIFGPLARLLRFADLRDQKEACRRIFVSDTNWTLVRGSDLEEGDSEVLPVWSRHVSAPVLASNPTRRTGFAMFMVHALIDDSLIREAPATVSCKSASALSHSRPHEQRSGDVANQA